MAKNKPAQPTETTDNGPAIDQSAPAVQHTAKPDPTPVQILTRVLGCGLASARAMLTGTDETLRAKVVEIYKSDAASKATLIRQLFIPAKPDSAA